MSDGTFVIVLVVCLVVAVGGFFTSIRLIRRVRSRAEAENAERDRSVSCGNGCRSRRVRDHTALGRLRYRPRTCRV